MNILKSKLKKTEPTKVTSKAKKNEQSFRIGHKASKSENQDLNNYVDKESKLNPKSNSSSMVAFLEQEKKMLKVTLDHVLKENEDLKQEIEDLKQTVKDNKNLLKEYIENITDKDKVVEKMQNTIDQLQSRLKVIESRNFRSNHKANNKSLVDLNTFQVEESLNRQLLDDYLVTPKHFQNTNTGNFQGWLDNLTHEELKDFERITNGGYISQKGKIETPKQSDFPVKEQKTASHQASTKYAENTDNASNNRMISGSFSNIIRTTEFKPNKLLGKVQFDTNLKRPEANKKGINLKMKSINNSIFDVSVNNINNLSANRTENPYMLFKNSAYYNNSSTNLHHQKNISNISDISVRDYNELNFKNDSEARKYLIMNQNRLLDELNNLKNDLKFLLENSVISEKRIRRNLKRNVDGRIRDRSNLSINDSIIDPANCSVVSTNIQNNLPIHEALDSYNLRENINDKQYIDFEGHEEHVEKPIKPLSKFQKFLSTYNKNKTLLIFVDGQFNVWEIIRREDLNYDTLSKSIDFSKLNKNTNKNKELKREKSYRDINDNASQISYINPPNIVSVLNRDFSNYEEILFNSDNPNIQDEDNEDKENKK